MTLTKKCTMVSRPLILAGKFPVRPINQRKKSKEEGIKHSEETNPANRAFVEGVIVVQVDCDIADVASQAGHYGRKEQNYRGYQKQLCCRAIFLR